MEKIYDMIVLGGGPAGYTAAMYAARSGLSTLVLEKLSAGGQMALTEKIDNYPGMEEGIDGFLLGEKMQKSAERLAVFFFQHARKLLLRINKRRLAGGKTPPAFCALLYFFRFLLIISRTPSPIPAPVRRNR